MLMLRSAAFNALFYVNLILLMVLGLPTLLFGETAVIEMARAWGRSSLWLLRHLCGTKVEYRGIERIPPGGVIVAAKHQSLLDILVLLCAVPHATFVFKHQLMRIPLFGLYLSRSGQIGIDRARGRAALTQAVRGAGRAIAAGRQLMIFPEGTRRPPGAPPNYKFGVAAIYAETRATCVPVALNSGLFWSRRAFLRRPGTLVVDILQPIEPGLDREAFLAELRERIETASDRLLDDALAQDPRLGRLVPPRG